MVSSTAQILIRFIQTFHLTIIIHYFAGFAPSRRPKRELEVARSRSKTSFYVGGSSRLVTVPSNSRVKMTGAEVVISTSSLINSFEVEIILPNESDSFSANR